MHSLWSSLLLGVCVAACSDLASTSSGDATQGTLAADATTGEATIAEIAAPDGTAAPETTAATEVTDPADTAPETPEVASPPSAANPEIHCQASSDCQPGEVCCTAPSSYLSACIAEAQCTAGQRDACLVDAQCAARRPGEWTTCCHDRGDRNYCAPSPDTCQPIVPCELVADCADHAPDRCCSHHSYYGASSCTSTFFATLPGQDCP
jgi:hypothetical protein